MFKIRRKTVYIASPAPGNRVGGAAPEFSLGRMITNAFTIIAGGLVGVLFFSAFFAVLLIPLAVWGARRWWQFRQMAPHRSGQILDAEYTVVDRGDADNGNAAND